MKPFLAGRPSLQGASHKSSATALDSASALPQVGGSGHTHGHGRGAGPSVECIKQGDKVVRLVITCTCGEKIELECLYPAGG